MNANVSPISAQRVSSLVNKLAEAKAALDRAESLYKELKANAIDTLGEGEFSSKTAKVTIRNAERPVLDQSAAKGYLTQGQLVACTKIASFTDLRVKFLA